VSEKSSDETSTGEKSCWDVVDRLYATIVNRKGADPATSYTAKLYAGGTLKIAQKFGEESVELVIEAMRGDAAKLADESADVLYHLLVVWANAGVTPEQVCDVLEKRTSMSGVEEKKGRALRDPQ
jgi:phosphoribosyl-ATP pyrophosphohydrolase